MKFFKHLAAVLAAAMIITLIPAQTANAAKYSKLAFQEATSSSQCITSFELAKGKTRDLKFYGVGDYKTTGIGWSSSNDAVATVDKNGIVKAVGVGSAQITYSAKGYISIPTTVVVTTTDYNVYIAEQNSGMRYTSYNLMLGKTVDFKFVGAKGWSTSLYSASWNTTDDSVATVDNYGIVTPVKIGTCQIVLTIIEKKTGKVAFAVQPVTINVKSATPTATPTPKATATPTATPTPKAGFSVKQISYNTAEITFANTAIKDSAISLDCDENPIIDTTSVSKGVVTVKFIIPLEDGKEYTVKNGNATETVKFKASVGAPASIGITYDCCGDENKAYAEEKVYIHANILDANGIALDQLPTVEYEYEGLSYPVWDDYDGNGYWFEAGSVGKTYKVTVSGTDNNGKVIAKSIMITVTNKPAYAVSKIEAKLAGIGESYSSKNATALSVSIGDETKGITIRYTDNRGNKNKETEVGSSAENEYGFFEFVSSNESILIVDDNGCLLPLKAGTVTVTVKFTDIDSYPSRTSTVGTFQVTVGAARYIASITKTYKSAQKDTLSVPVNGNTDFSTMTITYVFKDQNGSVIDPELVKLESDPQIKSSSDVSSHFSVTTDFDSKKKEYYITVTVDSNPLPSNSSTKRTNIYVYTKWLFNEEYNTRAKEDTTSRINVVDTSGNATSSYVAMWTQDSAESIGAKAGGNDLYVEASLVESKNGGYAGVVSNLKLLETEKITDEDVNNGQIFYKVQISGTGKSQDDLKGVTPTVENGKVKILVRKAFGSLGSTTEEAADHLSSIGTVSVTVTFYSVKKSGTRYVTNQVATVTKRLSADDPASSATVSITNNTREYDLTDASAWIDWLETHATISIKNGLTGESCTVNSKHSFDSYGIIAVPNYSNVSTYLRSLDLYLPNSDGSAYVKQHVSITANPQKK